MITREAETLRKARFWLASAIALGAALPFVILYRPGIMYTLVTVGIISGLLATSRPAAIAHIREVISSKVAMLICVLLVAFFVSSALGNTPLYSLRKWVQLPLAACGALALYVVLTEMPAKYKNLLLASLTTATVVITIILLVDLVLANPTFSSIVTGNDKPADIRFRSWSSASAVLLPFVAAWLFTTSNQFIGWAPRSILIICAIGLVVAGGRAGWVGAAAALLIWVGGLARWHSVLPRPVHAATAATVATSALGIYWLLFGLEFVTDRLAMSSSAGIMSGRIEIWSIALKHISDSPVFGIGLSGYRHLPDAINIHPHNWFLQLLLETGLIGTILFCALLTVIATYHFSKAESNIYALAGLASLTAFSIAGLANTSILNMWWVTYLIITTLLALVLTSSER